MSDSQAVTTNDDSVASSTASSIEINQEDVQEFFETQTPPANLEQSVERLAAFAAFHLETGRKIACVTSGGTIVPLEQNTVRFLDNFSQGTRGAASTEHFIQAGYAVVFLHRRFSRQPFSRHFSHHVNCFLDYLETDGESVHVSGKPSDLVEVLQQYKDIHSKNLVLNLDFVSVTDYLFLLRATAEALQPFEERALFFLAAAVSDYYIPEAAMVKHKIQSRDTHRSNGQPGLMLDLYPVPKMLGILSQIWAPKALVASFKLETDDTLLLGKAQSSIEKYGVDVVVANLLSTRSREVQLVTKDDIHKVTKEEEEIEQPLVTTLVALHDSHIASDDEKTTE